MVYVGMQDVIAEHQDFGKALEEDPVLRINKQEDLDALLAIAISNMKASGYSVGEVGSGSGALTKQVTHIPDELGQTTKTCCDRA